MDIVLTRIEILTWVKNKIADERKFRWRELRILLAISEKKF